MTVSILITQCLQRDFVDPLGPHAPLPNRLHVGHAEALRLLGPEPSTGPVAQLIGWARGHADRLTVLHLRDWHDPGEPAQREHLDHFGDHCLRNSSGAGLVLGLDETLGPNEQLIDALTLSDFESSALPAVLSGLIGTAPPEDVRVGVIGVWTDAKVSYLLYDLKTRLGLTNLATCSALTASASRPGHFYALDQLRDVLGVTVLDSVGAFADWLGGSAERPAFAPSRPSRGPRVEAPEGSLSPDDGDLIRWLFRDSAEVDLAPLGGGFSGARVFRASSRDVLGHTEAPSVVKVGPRDLIASERTAFERIEAVLGNRAPTLRGFVDLGDRGGLKYAYAAMGRGPVRTLKSLFDDDRAADPAATAHLLDIIDQVFGDVLAPLYAAARYERCPLAEHYGFSARWAPNVLARVAALVGDAAAADHAVVRFYRDVLASATLPTYEQHYVAYGHGDLNGANVLIDGRDNVWVIDFFHAARSHVWKDLIKLENDLLFLFTKVESPGEFDAAIRLTDALLAVSDLRAPVALPQLADWPRLARAAAVIERLRGFGASMTREDRNPAQVAWARLRYAVHTLGFDEASPLQRRWALHVAAGLVGQLETALRAEDALRVDFLPDGLVPGRLGLTICPGRTDRGRQLDDDLGALVALAPSVTLVSLVGDGELAWAGVPTLHAEARRRGIEVVALPIPDQGVPTRQELEELLASIGAALDHGRTVVIHCMGGLGRSGVVAAAALVRFGGSTPADAIATVRSARDPRAIETRLQERFVESLATETIRRTGDCGPR